MNLRSRRPRKPWSIWKQFAFVWTVYVAFLGILMLGFGQQPDSLAFMASLPIYIGALFYITRVRDPSKSERKY